MHAISDRVTPPPQRGDLALCLEIDATPAAIAATRATLAGAGDPGLGARPPWLVLHGPASALDALEVALGEEPSPRTVLTLAWGSGADARATALVRLAEALAPADLVLLGAGADPPPGWLDHLVRAARSDVVIATASALPSCGVTVPLGGADGGVAPGALRRLEHPVGPCVVVRRSALDLVGDAGLAGEDFLRGCRERCLAHVSVDDLIVAGGPALGAEVPRGGRPDGPARTAELRARIDQGRPLSVIVDARALDGPPNGTRLHIIELLRAVQSTGRVELTALVPASIPDDTRARLSAVEGVHPVSVDASGVIPAGLVADVVHRPHQVHSAGDLALLGSLAPRLVITQQDLIEFHNPGYLPSPEAWAGLRTLTRVALASADRVLFFSHHTRAEALAAELVEPARALVVPIGTDHGVGAGEALAPRMPALLADRPPDEELVLCLGTDLAHKNRLFALEVFAALQARHGFRGRLLFAGPHSPWGGTREAEAAWCRAHPAAAAEVTDLGTVSDAERAWLLGHAGLVLYPSVQEGFGLIPHEAAAAGVPCMWAPGSALGEVLDDSRSGLVPWDAAASAHRAWELLSDPAARRAQVTVVREAAARWTWGRAGEALVDAYRGACTGPPSPGAVLARQSALMSGEISPDGISLVGLGGLLPREAERPLLALLARPRLARPLLRGLEVAYRLGHRPHGR